jgi:transcriptional regulator with XRE-family HTH domain
LGALHFKCVLRINELCDPLMGQILVEELKKARMSRGLSRAALAAAINVDPQAIKRLESGVGSFQTMLSVMAELDYHVAGLAKAGDLPKQLRLRRQNIGLTVNEAAKRARVSSATILEVERGRGSVRSVLKILAAIAPTARRKAPARVHWAIDAKGDRDIRFTPPDFMANIYDAFGDVDLDPCGHADSPVAANRRILLAEGGDGLVDEWSGRLAYMNPPFSAQLRWLRRAHDQWKAGNVQTVVCLVPARTDSAWFHEHLRPSADIFLPQGRLRFLTPEGRGHSTPFSLMVVVLGGSESEKCRLGELLSGFWIPSATQD